MTPAECEHIARAVAAQSQGLDFEDVQQEVRVKLWLNPPTCVAHAWRIARNARNDWWRHERRHVHTGLDEELEAPHETTGRDTEAMIVKLLKAEPDRTLWMLTYYQRHRHSVNTRSKAFHYRKRLRAVLA